WPWQRSGCPGQLPAELSNSGPQRGRHALGRSHRQVALEVLERLLRLLVLHVDHSPEDERGAPVRVQVGDPGQLRHARLALTLDHLEEGAVDAEIGAERVRGERALVQLLRLGELAPADELLDDLGGQREVATRVVLGPGERALEVLVVPGSGSLCRTAASHGAGGGVALTARLLVLRQPEAEGAEEDDHPRSPGRPDELRVTTEEPARRRRRRGLALLATG